MCIRDRDIGMINHYYTLRVLAENGDSPVKNVYLDGGCGAMVMPAGAGVQSTSQNKRAALAFIEFLHSTSAQEHFTNTVYEFPLVDGITPNALLPEINSLNSPSNLNWSALALWQEKAVELIAQAGFQSVIKLTSKLETEQNSSQGFLWPEFFF